MVWTYVMDRCNQATLLEAQPGALLSEVNLEIQADHILVVDCVAANIDSEWR